MKTLVFLMTVLAVSGGFASSQTYWDLFNYAPGTLVPGWTEQAGDWSVDSNKQLVAEPRSLWQYITIDTFSALNGATEITAIYNTPSTYKLQFGGCAMRFQNTSTCVMNKIQDNNSSGDFDRFFVYDQPGGSSYVDPTPHKKTIVRLVTFDQDLIGKIDIDLDGKWDHVVVKPSTQSPITGKVGIAGYGHCIFDNFKFFDAAVRIDPQGLPPAPGNLIILQLRGTKDLVYQCACSSSNAAGIQVDSRLIPLDLTSMLVASLQIPAVFQNFSGKLDASGHGKAGIAIPMIPALSGLGFYFCMVTLDPLAPNGIANISNDLRIDIQ